MIPLALRRTASSFAIVLSAVWGAPAGYAQCLDQIYQSLDAQPNQGFFSASLDGNRAALGAAYDADLGANAGSVYVLERQPSGTWSIVDQLYASNAGTNQYFGREVTLSGDRIAATNSLTSRVHVFEKSAGTWSQTAIIDAPLAFPASDWFGDALALEGDLLAVGDWGQSTLANWSGVVHVFRFQTGNWVLEQTLTRNNAESHDRMGYSVAIDNGRVLAGVPFATIAVGDRSGGANLFEFQGVAWTETAFLKSGTTHNQAGWSCDISADTIVLGAPFGPMIGNNEGGAYVFEKGGAIWSQVADLTSGTPVYTQFGETVAVDGNNIALLAPSEAVIASPGIEVLTYGVAHLFRRTMSGWSKTAQRYASKNSGLPGALDLDQSTLILGQASTVLDSVQFVATGPSLVQPFCFCPEGFAPCDNEDSFGGCANATGKGAFLSACGSTSVVADDLRLQATSAPSSVFAVLVMGDLTQQPPLYIGNGRLCLADTQSLRRFHVEQASASGVITYGTGLIAESLQFPQGGHIQAGLTRHFQLWHRDNGVCFNNSGLSNALSITFSN